jgi:N4-gp56 family major capsid protein
VSCTDKQEIDHMSRTNILPTDPNKRKAWASAVANDATQSQYFSRMTGAEGSRMPVTRKTELSKGAGDEVTTALVAKFRGAPVIEGQKLAGNEFKLQTSSHTMRVNEFRQGVNIGARIEQDRVGYNLRQQGREKLTEYIKELVEQVQVCAISGARGVGDEISHFGEDYAGYPNALRAPDAAHLFTGTDGTKTKANLAAGDKMTLTTVNKLSTKAKKMLGGKGRAVKMSPASYNGKECFLLAVMPEVMQDIRDDAGAQGWFESQKALIAAIGKGAELFKGGAGMFNGVMIDEMEIGVRFADYGSAGTLAAARSLFMGAGAMCVANGTKGLSDGMTIGLDEETDDRGHDSVLFFEMIFGADKSQFDGMDYGVMSVDTAYTAAV